MDVLLPAFTNQQNLLLSSQLPPSIERGRLYIVLLDSIGMKKNAEFGRCLFMLALRVPIAF